jgi:membrane-associated phospholipid phosphatase
LPDTPYFRRTATFNQFNKVFSGTNMGVGTAIVPLSFYAVSLVRKDTYGQHTALLAGEAVADAEILTTVMKNVDRRLRPSDLQPHGDFDDTWFRTHASLTGGPASFPSGHAIAAFSVATIFADRYRDHRWVPSVAYGLAGLVSGYTFRYRSQQEVTTRCVTAWQCWYCCARPVWRQVAML